jgi:16S rRNA (guanine527-N7)-methyltransferase
MKPKLINEFTEGLKLLGVQLDESRIKQFGVYLDEILKWNARINIMGRVTDSDIVKNHFLDALSIVPVLHKYGLAAGRLIDVGSGAGLPGIALKIALPEINLTLLDSSEKKTEFMRHACHLIDIKTETVCGRAESVAKMATFSEQFDAATARAVAKPEELKGLCIPFLKPGGLLILPVSSATAKENASTGSLKEIIMPPEQILPGKAIMIIVR